MNSCHVSNRHTWVPIVTALAIAVLVLTPGIEFQPVIAQSTPSTPRNIVLFWDDYPTRGDPNYQVTVQNARPLVTYVDQNGNPTGWMFDSFGFYSLWLYFTKNTTQSYIDSWIQYLYSGNQIANLDLAVANAKTALNQPSYRMNVFLTIPVAYNNVSVSAILSNVDTLVNKWQSLNPSNLQLVGFYWGFTESLGDLPGLEPIAQSVAAYVHSKGYKMLIAPYRTAWYLRLHALGFDYVTMQPNYAWDPTSNITDFTTVNDRIVAGYVDGVELEVPIYDVIECCQGSWRTNLNTYVQQAYFYGWNHRLIQTYYHGTDISIMAQRSVLIYRSAYDTIHNYILSQTATLTPTIRQAVGLQVSTNFFVPASDMKPEPLVSSTNHNRG